MKVSLAKISRPGTSGSGDEWRFLYSTARKCEAWRQFGASN